jgi:hypothetical protein
MFSKKTDLMREGQNLDLTLTKRNRGVCSFIVRMIKELAPGLK